MASILLASQGQLTIACGLIFLAAVFDVFDGLAARALGGGTPLGAQLDSLADMVSFGVGPAMLVFFLVDSYPLDRRIMRIDQVLELDVERWITMLASLTIVIASAWRLAKFNIDTRQTTGFLGLPTPANALFWASCPLILERSDSIDLANAAVDSVPPPDGDTLYVIATGVRMCFSQPRIVLVLALILGMLMLSELPLPGLKFKHKGWKGNEVIFLLIGIGALLALLYGILAVPLILIIYLLSPLWGKLFPKAH